MSRFVDFEVSKYSVPSAWYGCLIIIIEIFLILLAFWLFYQSIWLAPLATLMLARGQWAMVDNIGHYATHGTLFRSKVINHLGSAVYFWPMFTTYEEWRHEHQMHHKFLGDESKDQGRQRLKRWGLFNSNFMLCFLLVPFVDLGRNLRFLAIWRDYRLFIFWCLVLAAVLYFRAVPFLMLWLFSFLMIRPYLNFISEVSEHWLEEPNHNHWSVGSRYMSGWIYNCLKPYGDTAHWLHHEYPGISPHRLKAAFNDLKSKGAKVPKEESLLDVWRKVKAADVGSGPL